MTLKLRGKNKDYTGMVIGKWTVLKQDGFYVSTKGVRRRQWLCRCECGNTRTITLSCSLYGNRKTTQCKECANKSFQKHEGFGGIIGSMWYTICQNAATRGHEVTVDPEHIWRLYELQHGKCALTGVELVLPARHKDKWHTNASLDRIDSSKGYVEGNLQWVDKKINLMKRDLLQSEFLEMCMKVANYNKLS